MAPDGAGSCPERQEEGIAAEDLVDFMEDMEDMEGLEEDDASTEFRDEGCLIYDEVENFYLQSGAAAVSIMQLPMCMNEEEIVSAGAGLGDIYLIGQSVSESRELRVLAEKWKLDLRPKFPPTFLVKTSCGWIRAQKPKVVYRRIMSDGLTLAHFLYYVRKHPSASADSMREHLANEFREFGEKPSLEKLSDFLPVIRRYMNVEMKMENPSILEEFFPGQFSDVLASSTARDIQGSCRDEELPSDSLGMDLNQEMTEERKHDVKHGVKSTSKYFSSTKAQRARVQAELRNLHSQWCTLLGGRATVKADKKPVSNKSRPSERENPVSRKSERTNPSTNPISEKQGSRTPLSKKTERPNSSKKGRPSSSDAKIPPAKRCQTLESETPAPKKGWTHIPSLESKTSTSDQREKSKPSTKLPNVQKSEEKTMNLKRKMTATKTASDNGNREPGPSRPSREVGPVGVHSPSPDLFDRLEDPPICTICDDGGDLICCEGPCQRHFHATAGTDTNCETLGLTTERVKRIDKYYCKNCLLQQHQCFICQELGSSAPSSSLGQQEVYICDAPGCRKFYHAGCVAKVLDPEQDNWTAMAERIERGLHGFLCPRHTCAVCEYKEIQPGAFVQCRRCPKAWHRDCLTGFSCSGELPTTEIWKHYDRDFIYCKLHKILPDILTPAQDHLRFPEE